MHDMCVAVARSFLLLCNISLYNHETFCLSSLRSIYLPELAILRSMAQILLCLCYGTQYMQFCWIVPRSEVGGL